MDRVRVLSIPDAPNWAALRFGVPEDAFELRILRDALRCEHLAVSYSALLPAGGRRWAIATPRMKINDEIVQMDAPAAVRVPGEQFRAIRPSGEAPAVFVVAGYPIDDPDETEILPNFWPSDE